MTRAVLSIGSNIGDSLAHLRSVTTGLGSSLVSCSPVYRSAPWGGVEQQDFLNAVVVVEDDAFDAWDWLRFGQRLEEAADRVRVQRWGPRSLDVDVVTCENVISEDPRLILPHPRAHERAFVLLPWLDVEPDATLRVGDNDISVSELLARLSPEERAGVTKQEWSLQERPVEHDGVGDGSW
ncbi:MULTISPECIES: 2-amino-4-hydroxy-6-hydroxymethyldihydropteridine diphosphokinase [unclassified Rhodococcus (in: high G+C Gram-positive bacteria)]|uniref:2-amino-4-hydroxy-6- hydroxymethyldihydropteridine diphosphokinase n=1 Tax=unclassified Rhodococcus (in: high G+C Gram-positive bacteria) TaxID=192944 RepID=UPI0007BBFFA2|nr:MULTISPECIES: 2-amino-4-hydroxy-6-hydroxymethyldihydropteridine diphosphokinase [unclassified Rhodococcus (in: high G+C Gram-positive bacteria)]KZE99718.1 2-amino-4-hydroxy-6-hydroxymethyldihydropteridine diphosphokinase [Rhodococcus sp. EPR-147]KZF00627.1 2-amino-4-hydroxy-6-hydroxymethyldihydropteridine diphosphokinase [Rhodococcus sp. EPR-279]